MRTSNSSPTANPESQPDPWERTSLVLGGIWIIFLAFPIITAWTSDAALWARLATVASLVLFAAVYMWGYLGTSWTHVARRPVAVIVVLAVLAALSYPVAGLNGPLTCLIFIMSYSIWAFPYRVSMGIATAALAVMLLVVFTSGEAAQWWFLAALAVILGIGLTVARTAAESGERHQETEKQLVMAQERERMGRDVHDLLGHTLTAITVKAELAEKLVDADPARARAELAEIQALSREAITEVRHTVGSLRARRLDSEIAGATAALNDAGITVTAPDDVNVVEPRLRMLFAWVVREATTNVLRHSAAKNCWIEIGTSRISIADDGQGVTSPSTGTGLRGLRERVEEAGGTLLVGTRDLGGTIVEVTA